MTRNNRVSACLSVLALVVMAGVVEAREVDGNVSLGAGYRVDELKWNIAGTTAGTNPNILSELTWSNLQIAQATGKAELTFLRRVYVRGDFAYGKILKGDNQDSDYTYDNRGGEFSRSNNRGMGRVAEASAGIGYRFDFVERETGKPWQAVPMVGYSRHKQWLGMRDGVQTITTTNGLPLGPFNGLNSTYDTDWSGPWVGMTLRSQIEHATDLIVGLEYHWANFYAEADWNLRDDMAHPVSFVHDATGQGLVFSLEAVNQVSKRWQLKTRLDVQNWTAGPGTDSVYTVDQLTGAGSVALTRLNEVNWRSVDLGLELMYKF